MAQIIQGTGLDINVVADNTFEEWEDNITITKVTVSGVKEVRVTHPEMVAQIGEVKYTIPAATKSVNTVDVVSPTTYYCYYKLVNFVPTWVASTTHPDLAVPALTDYVWIRLIRFMSVSDVATIELVQRQLMAYDQALHQIADGGYLMPPMYISGFAPTFNLSTGVIDLEAGKYRRITGSIRSRAAITAGVIYEPAIDLSRANFALIEKYADGSAITATKYVKLLVGVLVNADSDYDFIVNIQGKPSTEYTTAAEAWTDTEHKASLGFSATRRSAVLPICWVVMKVGDASTIVYQDIREVGMVASFGGVAGVTSHGALSNLTVVADHPDYLLKDGSRALTGNMAVDALVTIDGVDISVHAANTEAHHATVTLAASATGLMDLTGQAISLDTQTASTVLAGPVVGASAATPTFRQLNIQDIARPSGTMTLANGVNNNVTLTAGTRVYVVAGPTAPFSITGFTGGVDGSVLYVYNPISENLTITNEGATSTAANRILLMNATNNTTGIGFLTFVYIAGTVNRWILASVAV